MASNISRLDQSLQYRGVFTNMHYPMAAKLADSMRTKTLWWFLNDETGVTVYVKNMLEGRDLLRGAANLAVLPFSVLKEVLSRSPALVCLQTLLLFLCNARKYLDAREFVKVQKKIIPLANDCIKSFGFAAITSKHIRDTKEAGVGLLAGVGASAAGMGLLAGVGANAAVGTALTAALGVEATVGATAGASIIGAGLGSVIGGILGVIPVTTYFMKSGSENLRKSWELLHLDEYVNAMNLVCHTPHNKVVEFYLSTDMGDVGTLAVTPTVRSAIMELNRFADTTFEEVTARKGKYYYVLSSHYLKHLRRTLPKTKRRPVK